MTEGALISKFDSRDYKINSTSDSFPNTFELTNLPRVKNQRNISSCVAHVIAEIAEYFYQKEYNTEISMSTDYIYGNQYNLTGRTDRGMYLRDACKIFQQYGDCKWASLPTNTEMPYCIDKIKQLSDKEKEEALNQRIKSYARCGTEKDMKYALTEYGPLLASISYNNTLEVDKNNIATNVISNGNKNHGIMVYGWNEIGWLCQNSWGTSWGNKGRFIVPFNNKFKECWSFIDLTNENITIPKNNCILNIVYKALNLIVNAFKNK